MKPNNNDKNNLQNTLDDVLINKMHSKAAFVLLLLLYAATTAAIRMIALGGANTYLMLIGRSVPIGGFTGILSNLSKIIHYISLHRCLDSYKYTDIKFTPI